MRIPAPFGSTSMVFLFLLLFVLCTLSAGADEMYIIGRAMAYGGTCQPDYPNVLAGSCYFLSVTNTKDQPIKAIVPGWPEGYILEAALDWNTNQPYCSTSGLIQELTPSRYISLLNRSGESDLLQNSFQTVNAQDLNAKYFVLHIPSDLAGHSLSFRARYQGASTNLTSNIRSISVIAACDNADSARVIASQIYAACNACQYARAIEIADSMLTCNLSDIAGWSWAIVAARFISQYDKAIAYLDRMYQDYGVIINLPSGMSLPARLNRDAPRDPQQQDLYERKRASLLIQKAQYMQQQQQR